MLLEDTAIAKAWSMSNLEQHVPTDHLEEQRSMKRKFVPPATNGVADAAV